MSSGYDAEQWEDRVKTNVFDPVLLSRLVRYVRPYWRGALAAFSLTLVSGVLALSVPLIVAGAVDIIFRADRAEGVMLLLERLGVGHLLRASVDAAGGRGETVLIWFAAAFFAAKVLQFAADWSNGYLLARLSQRVLFDLRMETFNHIHSRSLRYFHRMPVGRLVTRVTNDVGALDQFFGEALMMVLKDSVMIVGVAALLFTADWRLALIIACVAPPMIVITLLFRRHARPAYRRFRASLSTLNAVLAETVSGIRVVQLFHREQANDERYRELGGDHRRHFLDFRRAWAIFRPGFITLEAIAVGLVLWFGGAWTISGSLGAGAPTFTYGMLTLFILLAEMFFRPIRDVTEKFDVIQSAVTAAERIFTVLDEEDHIPEQPNALAPLSLRGEIVFEGVWFAYGGDNWVLRDVSLEVKPGQTVAIVGHTGAGKSTIINLISRFYDVGKGRVLVDGRDVRDYTLSSLRSRIAVVHQDVFLFAGSVRENISLGNPEISEARVVEAAKTVGAHDFIMRLPGGYAHELQEAGKTFSAGERQLLSFARALAHDPAVLVLDEATSSIDTRSEELIRRAMGAMMRGRTSVVIAHRLSTIQAADKIVVMHHGQIAESGTHRELLVRRGIYHRLYQLQFAGRGGAVPIPAE